MSLPVETIYDIIDELTGYATPDSYGYEEGVVQTLVSLTRVSRAVRSRAIFHLYSCVSIRSDPSGAQIARLLATGLPYASLTHTLEVTFEVGTGEAFQNVVCLVHGLAPSLKRLLFNPYENMPIDVYEYLQQDTNPSHDLTEAMADLPQVRQLTVTLSMESFFSAWRTGDELSFRPFERLRVLILTDIALISDTWFTVRCFLERSPNLEILGLSWLFDPSSNDEALGIHFLPFIPYVFEASPTLKQLCFFHVEEYSAVFRSSATQYKGADQGTVVDVMVAIDQSDLSKWIADSVREGTIWTVPTRKWRLDEGV